MRICVFCSSKSGNSELYAYAARQMGQMLAESKIGSISAASEIEEIRWIDPDPPYDIELAPLSRDVVLPLAARVR
jgi:hypothetical protein